MMPFHDAIPEFANSKHRPLFSTRLFDPVSYMECYETTTPKFAM